MTRYIYDCSGRFWDSLPMRDLDDEELDKRQSTLLEAAVEAGAYKVENTPALTPVAKEKKHGSKQETEAARDTGDAG